MKKGDRVKIKGVSVEDVFIIEAVYNGFIYIYCLGIGGSYKFRQSQLELI